MLFRSNVDLLIAARLQSSFTVIFPSGLRERNSRKAFLIARSVFSILISIFFSFPTVYFIGCLSVFLFLLLLDKPFLSIYSIIKKTTLVHYNHNYIKENMRMDFYGFYTGKIFDAYQYLGAHTEKHGVTFRTFAPSDRKSTRLNSSHKTESRMPSSA